MKIVSWNVNGIRAVHKHGFLDFLDHYSPEILCLQEIKCDQDHLPSELKNISGYYSFFNPAIKKGYSGTAVYTKERPINVETKLGLERFDNEGRLLRLDFPDFTLINLYLPHGGRQKENLEYKITVYGTLHKYLLNLKSPHKILIGDFNIAHKEIDLARPKDNVNNIMFTLEEREQIESLIDLGFVDTFRMFNKEGGNYSWWPYFLKARERNLGWRIDYTFVSKSLELRIKDAFLLPLILGSDHCPIGIKY